MQRFERANLAEEVANLVRDMILDGRLPAGGRINEVRLAAEIGVSRTPLREALSRLVNEGSLKDVPRRGFFVRPLTAEEFRQIYPIRAILDPAALRLAGIPPRERIASLRKINHDLERCTDRSAAVRIDDAFHLELLVHCPNRVLVDLIRQFMWQTRRYELGLMQRFDGVAAAVAAHEQIIVALETGDLDGACRALEANMTGGMQPILDWLAERERTDGGDT